MSIGEVGLVLVGEARVRLLLDEFANEVRIEGDVQETSGRQGIVCIESNECRQRKTFAMSKEDVHFHPAGSLVRVATDTPNRMI